MKNSLKPFLFLICIFMFFSGCQSKSDITIQSTPKVMEISPTSSSTFSSNSTLTPTAKILLTNTPTPEQQRDLKNGLEGADVQLLENQLLSLGYSEIGLADGIFGNQDEAAVKHFQLLSNLPITGVVDEVTFGSFESENPAANYLPPAFPGKVSPVSSTTPVCDDHALQDRLAVLGYLQPGSEEWSIGAFGPETKAALIEFQKSYMDTANGIPDLETWKKLFSPIPQWTFGGATVEVETWQTSIYPSDQDVVALAWDGSRLWMAVSKGGSVYENYLIRIDPNEHPAEAVTIIRPRDCETQNAQIANMVFAGEKIWLLYSADGKGNPVPLLQTIDPDTGIAHTPFQFASCPDGYCVPTNGIGVTKGQLWVAANDRAYQIDPSSGKVIISRPVGFLATGKMVFDGQCFWYEGEASTTSFNPLGGACRSSNSDNLLYYGFPETDGTLVWTLNYDGSLSQLNLNTGVGIMLDPVVSNPITMVYGNKHLWINDDSTNTVIGFSPESGSYGDPIQLKGDNPDKMLQESNNLWVFLWGSSNVERVSIDNYLVTPVIRTATAIFTLTPSPTPPILTHTLSLTTPNMQGDDILQLQNALLSLGYIELGIPDGSFGKLTDKAVRRFQEENGLTVDGIVGPLTWQELFNN